MPRDSSAWWEPIILAAGEGRRWRVGTLELALVRTETEWLMSHRHLPDGSIAPEGWSRETVGAISDEDQNPERFAADVAASEARLLPRVAERSVVAFPRIPLHVLPRHEAKFYVSSPVWVQVTVGNPAQVLREIPVRRLSDTWFGPSTREGEVAFALKTHAHARIENVPAQSQRATTPVVVRNRSDDLLSIDRLNLPVPYLSIFHSTAGDLWTEEVILNHLEDSGMATLDVQPGAPAEAEGGVRLSDPRLVADENLLVRAFSRILRTFDPED